tara:strand:- start:217 stop:393 length:177 start_codon:yes stop_codon:yes gene_type:complete
MSSDAQIFQLEKNIVKSIDKLNENLLTIAWQLYLQNNGNQYATIKGFLAEKEGLQRDV